jgi:hypothetical protein
MNRGSPRARCRFSQVPSVGGVDPGISYCKTTTLITVF